MADKVNLFTFLNQIQSKRKTVSYDKKIAGSYILSLFLSMNKELISKVDDINKYLFLLPDEIVYDYYMSSIPVGKRYLNFIKKRKEDDKMKKRIEKLKEFNPTLSTRECKMILTYIINKNVRGKYENKYQKF